VDSRQGIGRPRSARKDENTDQVNYMVLSQEERTTHELIAQFVKHYGRQAFISYLLSALHEKICSWDNKFELLMLKGGAQTYSFVVNFTAFQAVKEFWRLVQFSPSYNKFNLARFLETQCRL